MSRDRSAIVKDELKIDNKSPPLCILKQALKVNKQILKTFNPSSGYSLCFPPDQEKKNWGSDYSGWLVTGELQQQISWLSKHELITNGAVVQD